MALGELPDFEVMTWQLCHLLRSALICVSSNSFKCKGRKFKTIIVEFLRKILNKKRVQIALSKNFKLWFQPSTLRLYNQASIVICHF